MSPSDQSRHFSHWLTTSGLPRKADIVRAGRHVSKMPCADIFFEANLVISRMARFKRTTKILESLVMSADATIRRLRLDDANSFRAIRLEAVKANPEALGSTFEFEDKLDVAWFAGRLENSHVMGAFRDGELVGTAGFAIQQGQKNAHKGRLWGMYVQPSSRNLGVGRLLVSAVLDVARENVELIQLSVVKENRPARRLYESLGFLEFGMEPKASKLGEKYYDEAHMALDFSRSVDFS